MHAMSPQRRPRALIALLENHQRADGSIGIPSALRPYCGRDEIARRGIGRTAPRRQAVCAICEARLIELFDDMQDCQLQVMTKRN